MFKEIELREFKYKDKRITHLLGLFDDFVRSIKNYDGRFGFTDADEEAGMLKGYRDSAFGILLSLLQLGHITTGDFHMRMQSLYIVYHNKVS